MTSQDSYKFILDSIDDSCNDSYQLDTLVYKFESLKSHHQYVVHIERYIYNLHCVKFFDDSDDCSEGKFSHLTATNEPRTIFRTVAYIAQDVLRNNPKASFLFIGAADKRDKPGHTTRRFRVYVEFLHQLDLYDLFLPVEITNLSMLVLVNKDSVSNVDAYINQIIEFLG